MTFKIGNRDERLRCKVRAINENQCAKLDRINGHEAVMCVVGGF